MATPPAKSAARSKKFSKEPEKFGTGHDHHDRDRRAVHEEHERGADAVHAEPQNIYAVYLLFIVANLLMVPLGWLCIKAAKQIRRVPRTS